MVINSSLPLTFILSTSTDCIFSSFSCVNDELSNAKSDKEQEKIMSEMLLLKKKCMFLL